MTAFRYRAARADGELLHGTVDAGSAEAALRLVESRGLFPVALDLAPESRAPAPVRGSAELAATLAGLAALLEAGLPVDRALAATAETASEGLAPALEAARGRVREGQPLSSALAEAQAVPALVVGYLKAGERTGRLAHAVQRAADELERDAETRARVRAALTYPAFLAVAGAVSVTAIVVFVVPRFAKLLGDQGRMLPFATRALIAASTALTHVGVPALTLIALGVAAALRAARTPEGALALHRRLLALPVVGPAPARDRACVRGARRAG